MNFIEALGPTDDCWVVGLLYTTTRPGPACLWSGSHRMRLLQNLPFEMYIISRLEPTSLNVSYRDFYI